MLDLTKIKVGDVLAYKPTGFLGHAIQFFSPGKYAHIGLVYDMATSFEMGGSVKEAKAQFLPLNEVAKEASRIDILRVYVGGEWLMDKVELQKAFQEICKKREGQPYAFKRIGRYAIGGFVSKIPLVGLLVDWIRTKSVPEREANNQDVCSDLAAECLEGAIRTESPDFDLVPGIGENRCRPSDLGRCENIVKIC